MAWNSPKSWGDDSEWSHGKDFLQNLAKKFEVAEEHYRMKDFSGFYDELMVINPDVEMFLDEKEYAANEKKMNEAFAINETIRKRAAKHTFLPYYLKIKYPITINHQDRQTLYRWFCFLKRMAKNHGLVTKLSGSFRDKMRKKMDEL